MWSGGLSTYFLLHGREADFPVQRDLNKPWLKGTARLWLQRLWKARIMVYEAQHWLEGQRRNVLVKSTALVPISLLVMVR